MSKAASQIVRVPVFSPGILKGLGDYWKIQLQYNKELTEKLLAACMEIPGIAEIIRDMPKELMEKNNREGIERSRRAFEGGEWEPYFLRLRIQGEQYAQTGITFGAWIELLQRYRTITESYIAAHWADDPARAMGAISAMNELLNLSIEIIGEAYIGAREQVIQRQKEELVEANEVMEQFAVAASHDLRSPLRAIALLATWIQKEVGEHPSPDLTDHLRLLHLRVKRMTKLIDDLLEYSKAGQKGDLAKCDLGRLIKDIVETLPPHEGIQIILGQEFPSIDVGEAPLRQVLSNLVSNAVKHHEGGGYVKVSAQDKGENIEIAVEDDGPGIDARYHERIFDIFQTLKSKDQVEGNGIGLALVKKTLPRHGGSVSLQSAPGQGSIFRVLWPKGA